MPDGIIQHEIAVENAMQRIEELLIGIGSTLDDMNRYLMNIRDDTNAIVSRVPRDGFRR